MSVFQLLTYQNSKLHAKTPFINTITLSKNMCFKCFELVTLKSKNECNLLYTGKREITRSVYYEFFFLFLGTKILKRMNSTLYRKTNNITKNVYFECFLTLLGSKTARGKEGSYMGKRNSITKNVSFQC